MIQHAILKHETSLEKVGISMIWKSWNFSSFFFKFFLFLVSYYVNGLIYPTFIKYKYTIYLDKFTVKCQMYFGPLFPNGNYVVNIRDEFLKLDHPNFHSIINLFSLVTFLYRPWSALSGSHSSFRIFQIIYQQNWVLWCCTYETNHAYWSVKCIFTFQSQFLCKNLF